jgi:glycosyltransferase involved in cell wall biosynthesis
VLPIGTANDLYFDDIGVPKGRRFLAPYTVDNAYFRAQRIDRARARRELGLDEDAFVPLYCGKVVDWKDPLVPVDACARLPKDRPVCLMIAGDGPMGSEVESRARSMGVALKPLGFVNQGQLGAVYSAADVLVLPSRSEPWGLVVNEAMNFSLPVVVSSRVGSRLDLVRDGMNGAVFPVGSVDALAQHLARLQDRDLAARWGRVSASVIDAWGLERTVDGVVRAVEAVV